VVTQVGSALAAAHREGIVHRDLKPDNIFLCPTDLGGETRDVVKILDFGISKMRGANTVLTQDSALIGTPQYMAPEQATGANDDIDARTDVFAFGAITFEMFAGRPPFWGDSLASVVYAVVYAPSPPLAQHAPEVPPTVAAAVARALEKNRDARFPDVLSFVRAVTGVGEASPAALGSASTMATPMPGALPLMAPVVGRTIRLDEGVADAGVSPSQRATAPERSQSAIPTNRVERPRSNPGTRVLIGVAALVVVFGAGFMLTRKGPAPQPATPAAKALTEASEERPSRTAELVKPGVAHEATTNEGTTHEGTTHEATTHEATTHEATTHEGTTHGATTHEATTNAMPADRAKSGSQPDHAKPEPTSDAKREAKSGKAGARDEVMSPAALADLEEAERALDAGKPAEALRLAQHSLYAQKSSRAYAVMARARCGQGDLGNAKAAFALLPRGQRGPVARACRKLGIELR